MAKRGGLGKGLDAIIPGDMPSSIEGGALIIPIEKIVPNPRQPRLHINQEELEGLAASIREHGVLQPLVLTQQPGVDGYILVAGERRWRASQMAGLITVPAIIRQVTEQQLLELALIENVQRADLTPLETAEAYRQLTEEFGLSHEEVATRVGKSRTSVTNTLRLLSLSNAVRQALVDGTISEGHGRALRGLSSDEAQSAALHLVEKNQLSVRQTEDLVRKINGDIATTAVPTVKPPPIEVLDLEEKLRSSLNTRVRLKHGKKGGSLMIYYFSDEELNKILALLLK